MTVNWTLDIGQVLVAVSVVGGFVLTVAVFRAVVTVRLDTMEQLFRDAFGPQGRIAQLEGRVIQQGETLQRVVGRVDSDSGGRRVHQ